MHNQEIAEFADFLFLAVQPSVHKEVLGEIKEHLKEDVVIITMAAGMTTKQIEEELNRKVKVVRTMPNTPALVGEGMTALSSKQAITETELAEIKRLLNSFGKTEVDKRRPYGCSACH